MADKNEGHRTRLKEKFLRGGLKGFLEYEIVELLLTLGTPRRDCKQPAKDILRKYKTLGGVLEASREDLHEVNGVGANNIIGIKLIREVAHRFLKDRMMSKPICHSSKEVFDYLYLALRETKREKFKVIFMDAKNQIIEEKTLSEGTVDSSVVYPREIIREALKYSASSLIFVHNHPSGDPTPSGSDLDITKELVLAAQIMPIKVLDHIIIGNNRYFSFADEGLIDDYEFISRNLKRS